MRSVSNIVQCGGTRLRSARCLEMTTKEGQEKAVKTIKEHGIEGLVVIGGDGSFRGAKILSEEYGIPTIGIPGTIDNDLEYTDYTLGFDTAVNTCLDIQTIFHFCLIIFCNYLNSSGILHEQLLYSMFMLLPYILNSSWKSSTSNLVGRNNSSLKYQLSKPCSNNET